jgi:hypothetical protein
MDCDWVSNTMTGFAWIVTALRRDGCMDCDRMVHDERSDA